MHNQSPFGGPPKPGVVPQPQPAPGPEPEAEPKKKRKRRSPSGEEFARLYERAARVLNVDSIGVSPVLGTGRHRIFVSRSGKSLLLETPPLTTREAYAFLLGLSYPRAGEVRPT